MNKNNINHRLLHWISLSQIMDILIDEVWFEELDKMLQINCFCNNPSKQSSLKFLRKTEWARLQIQGIYIKHMRKKDYK